MPAVFVHGVPDTARLWEPLIAATRRSDAVALPLPGFATPTPDGWTATKESYADWLETELVEIGEPVDLVGHDWGALLCQRVASVRPDLIRTLAVGSGPLDVEYEWHAMAQAWQTPTTGEDIMAGMLALPAEDLAAGLAAGGAPADLAQIQASHVDARMVQCILALYRSAVSVGHDWQPQVDVMPHRPAVVFHGADDPYMDTHFAQRLADRLGGELVVHANCGHWWPWARATDTAGHLRRLWA